MTGSQEARAWIDRYTTAWKSNNVDDIRAVFTDDAVYNGRPNDPDPWRGIDAIIAGWLDHRDEEGDWGFVAEILGEVQGRTVIRGVTTYTTDVDYDNLWLLVLTDGKASEFTEWFMERAE